MRNGYRQQFEPWRPRYAVIPSSEYAADQRINDALIVAAALIANNFINRMVSA